MRQHQHEHDQHEHEGEHHGHDQHEHEHHGEHGAGLAELLDLDADVLHEYLSEVTTWLRRQTEGAPPRRILDLGAGTGTGTLALAQRFGAAEVIAVDASEHMLNRVMTKALDLGIADRVRTVQADVAAGWPAIDSVDIVWASNSLHEMADPDRVFKNISAALRPGGLLAVAEMDSAPRFLPDDIELGRPGLESRWRSALQDNLPETQPQLGPDWGPSLDRAGFTLLAKRQFVIDLEPPHTAPVARYAHAYLRRILPFLKKTMSADDLVTIDVLLDSDRPESLARRGDLNVRNGRTVWLARQS